MIRSPLRDIPPFDDTWEFPDTLFVPYVWGPLPYLRRKRANWRARRERRRGRRVERRSAAHR